MEVWKAWYITDIQHKIFLKCYLLIYECTVWDNYIPERHFKNPAISRRDSYLFHLTDEAFIGLGTCAWLFVIFNDIYYWSWKLEWVIKMCSDDLLWHTYCEYFGSLRLYIISYQGFRLCPIWDGKQRLPSLILQDFLAFWVFKSSIVLFVGKRIPSVTTDQLCIKSTLLKTFIFKE